MNRREYVTSLVCGLTAISGCQSRQSEETQTPESSQSDATTTETEGCRDGRMQYPKSWKLLEEYDKIELSAEPTTVTRGEPITFRLRNRTSEEQLTGNDRKYSLQRKSTDGWGELLYFPTDSGFLTKARCTSPERGSRGDSPHRKTGFRSTRIESAPSLQKDDTASCTGGSSPKEKVKDPR